MIFSKSRPVKIVLVGTGGTGGYIVPQLYRLLYALDRPIRVILCDGDLVEEKNLGRQNFIEADLGKNKAMVLAERYSNAFGIETSYIPQYVEDEEMLEELLEPLQYPQNRYVTNRNGEAVQEVISEIVILIGAVDNNRSRQVFHNVFQRAKELIYIDSGNSKASGQVICGVRRSGKTFYQPVASLYPEVLEQTDKFPTELSCAEASISAPQTIAANLAAATIVTIHIYNILAEGNNHSVGKSVFSTKSVNIQSFKKNVKRRKSQATLFFSRNSCTIACCNLNQWCQATIPAQGDEFSLTLYDTQRLLDACAYFSGELHLEYETAEKKPHNCDIPYNQARFSCGGREIHQLVFDSDLYPLPKEFQPEQVYQINAGTVFGLFTQVRHAVSSDTNRPWSCCVQFTDHRMYALDGYRLSVRAIPDFEAAKPFQIPEEAMELLSVFADEDCTLSIGREWLSVQNDSKRLITRVPPLGGLKLDSTIPTIFTEERWIDVEGTRNDLKYLLKMENKKLRAPLRLGDGWLSVRGNSGLYRAELRMERPPAIVIGYDPRYLLDAFDAFAKRGIKTARMSFTSPVGPTVLTADNGFTELILPVRLKPEEATTYIPPRKQAA